jgi:RNA polymerase sigma factor (sigma-70 family)
VTETEREERFRRLYEANRRSVLAYALRRTTSHEDAADVVAEAFMAAWRRLDDLPQGEAERLWLYAAARGVIANLNRRAQRGARLIERVSHEQGRTSTGAATDTANESALLALTGLASLGDSEGDPHAGGLGGTKRGAAWIRPQLHSYGGSHQGPSGSGTVTSRPRRTGG